MITNRSRSIPVCFILLFLLFFSSATLTGQPKQPDNMNVPQDRKISLEAAGVQGCTDVSLNAYPVSQSTLQSYNDLMTGATNKEYITVQYSPGSASCTGWSLKVRATGNFTNGVDQLSPQYLSMRFNRVSRGKPSAGDIGVSFNPVPLSTSDVTLIDHSNASFSKYLFTEHKFDFIIQGGNQLLLLSNGRYITTLIFSLFDASNRLVATSNIQAEFQVNTDTNNSYTLLLQNSADQISLNFSTPTDLVKGVSAARTNGLKIVGYRPYQVIVKTSGSEFVSSDPASRLPVSVVKLQVGGPASLPGISCRTFSLSPADQVFISNPLSDYRYQTVQYNLNYYTSPMDARMTTVRAGTYTTNVLFVIIPQ